MTTKEASQLVILAGSFKNESNPSLIYLLDMGQPIRIIDLAKNDNSKWFKSKRRD